MPLFRPSSSPFHSKRCIKCALAGSHAVRPYRRASPPAPLNAKTSLWTPQAENNPQPSLRELVDLLDVSQSSGEVELEVLEQAVIEAKDPTVDDGEVVLGVGLLDGCGLDNVAALLDDIELDEAIIARGLVGDSVEFLLVKSVDVPDVPEPGVEDAEVLGCHGGLNATAAVVTADHDMLDLEVLDGVVENRGDVEVDVAHQVGNVAVHKGLAGLEARDLLGGDARVAAAYPQVLGLLALAELGEELRVLCLLVGRPLGVMLEHTVVRLLQVPGDLFVRHDAPEVAFGGGW